MTKVIERHFSAFKGELQNFYLLKKGSIFLDLTLGDGGHTEEALKLGCRVISFEQDGEAIERAINFVPNEFEHQVIETDSLPKDFVFSSNWLIVHGNFTNVSHVFKELNLPIVNGIMVDLGPSQYQVLNPDRGMTFAEDSYLDMRMDKSLGVTAADLLSVLNEGELADLFEIADESYAKPIAKAIAVVRKKSPIQSTKQLADIVCRVKHQNAGKIHPATQVFMALRMAVNLERDNIRELLPQLHPLLVTDGILGIISFHSGEDKLIKEYLRDPETEKILSAINKKPIMPTIEELKISQRTRSAKIRLAKKII